MIQHPVRFGKIEAAVSLHLTGVALAFNFVPSPMMRFGFVTVLSLGLAFYLRRLWADAQTGFKTLALESHELKAMLSEFQSAAQTPVSTGDAKRTLAEIAAAIESHFKKMQDAVSKATITQLTAQSGQQAAQLMADSVASIIQDTEAISGKIDDRFKKITEVVKVISQIETKTKVINDIVFQTKLLSFNASVEAARAGEQGKGFAVVAEEIGLLAQMSGVAAKDITQMLASSLDLTKKIVDETRESMKSLFSEGKETLAGGAELAKHCGQVMQEISNNADDSCSTITELAQEGDRNTRKIDAMQETLNQLELALATLLRENLERLEEAEGRISEFEIRIAHDQLKLAA